MTMTMTQHRYAAAHRPDRRCRLIPFAVVDTATGAIVTRFSKAGLASGRADAMNREQQA